MHIQELNETIEIPEGVQAKVDGTSITITGPKGEFSRHVGSKKVTVSVSGNEIKFLAKNATKRERRTLQTGRSHTKNMIKGVTEGHVYKLKICSGHFPMSVAVKGTNFEVKNFIGEKVPRVCDIKEGVSVKIDGMDITVESASKELAGNQASAIEQLTRRPGFDTRIFQDGIFIVEKDGKTI